MIEAVGENVIVKAIYPEKGKTLVLTSMDDKPICWEIVSRGDDVKCVYVGDKVFMAPYGMQEINYQSNKYYVCRMDNILARNVL